MEPMTDDYPSTLARSTKLSACLDFLSDRTYGDNASEPILAKGQTVEGLIWTYVCDDGSWGDRPRRASVSRSGVAI